MTVSLWRIAIDTPGFTSDELCGTGSQLTGGRWNSIGNAVVYTASNIALACLENLVHISGKCVLANSYLVRIDVSDEIWQKAVTFCAATAPVGWDAEPKGKVSLNIGDQWLASQQSALLTVPSVVVPEEHGVLINPAHADARHIKATKIRKWLYDARFFKRLLFSSDHIAPANQAIFQSWY